MNSVAPFSTSQINQSIERLITTQAYDTFYWAKARVRYFIHNWIYTTNHKRIAINYFLFVILSGIVGLVLATAIRLEFAYPGVGIFAGDSLQYLTVASAHGVVMVFFMIMPLLFGAFANFLLPTQLGVHDVAFPRLNSAAFWFLPGGLIMLAQMICVDRRYQRMNCFNVREVEALLKQRFFPGLNDDIVWTHRLPGVISALRFQQNGSYSDLAPVASAFTSAPRKTVAMRNQLVWQPRRKSIQVESDFFPFRGTTTESLPSLPPIITMLASHVVSIWLFLLSIIVGFVKFFKGATLLCFDLLVYFVALPHLMMRGATLDWRSTRSSLLKLEDVTYWLTTPQYYPWVSLYDTQIYPTQRYDTYVTILNFVYPAKEVTKVLYECNAFVFEWIWLIVFNAHLLYDYQEEYYRFIPTQFLMHLQDYNNIYYEFTQLYWNLVSLMLSITGLNQNFERISSIDEVNESIKFSRVCQLQLIQTLIAITQDVGSTLVYLATYAKTLLFSVTLTPHPLLVTVMITRVTDETTFLSPTHLLTSTRLLANSTVWNKVASMQTLADLTVTPIRDFSHVTYTTTKKGLSLLTHPYNFSNFVDVYYTYVTSFYELNRMHKIYFTIFNDIQVITITGLTPVEHWLRIMLEKWTIVMLLLFETLWKFFSIFQISGYVTTASISWAFMHEVYLQLANLVLTHYPRGSISVPPLLLSYWALLVQGSWWVFSEMRDFVTSSAQIRFQFLLEPHLLFGKIQTRAQEFFPLFFQLKQNATEHTHQIEHSVASRHIRSANPSWKYDYKTGDYFPKVSKEQNTHLFPSLLTFGGTTPWFLSSDMRELVTLSHAVFTQLYMQLRPSDPAQPFSYDHSPLFPFYAFASHTESITNSSPFATWSSLNQQFYRLFLTSSLQQRVFTNWRQLKFTREAWRCKLLSARHQKTLYRRYLNEDGIFWSIERNARDLLPGWAMITPFSSRTRFTAVGKVDIGLMGVLLVLNSSIISAANFLVTYRYLSSLNNRKMRDARSFFAEGVMVASWMMIAANPMLVIGIIMLLSDRHWQTSFFDYSGGGDTILFQHMFWFFGHPEVYIIMIPVFGFTNTTLSYYLRKRVSARASLMYSMYTIAFLGFFVWGHHMYMVGLAHTTRMLFSTLTVMISVPAATKLMHWCVTIANSSFVVELPLLFTLTFIFLFVSGGISGMCVAHTGMDVLFHDTFYVIGHFHVMLAGAAMFGSFGAFYFYFSAIFGVKYSRLYSYLHYAYYLTGQIITVAPMFWLGYAGMPRRVLDYPASLGGWHSLISGGHLLSVAGIISFFIMIFDSLRQARAALRTTLGINRYNTRLNFYLFEISRLKVVKQKFGYVFNFIFRKMLVLRRRPLAYFEEYESTLITYTFHKRK